MLNKKKFINRINITIFLLVSFIITLLSLYIESNYMSKLSYDKFSDMVLKTDFNNIFITESLTIDEDGSQRNLNNSYLFYDGYVLERKKENQKETTKKYIDNEVYSFVDNVWYREPSKGEIPIKIDIKMDDFDGIKCLSFPIAQNSYQYVCKVKDEKKEKYIPVELKKYFDKESLYIILEGNEKIENISFNYLKDGVSITCKRTIAPVDENTLINIPENSIDVGLIEDVYGEDSVSEVGDNPYTEKITLYNNYEMALSEITIPAGFTYDKEISTKSEIYMNEIDGYGEIIVKGKCDSIIEKMLTNGIYEYEENSCIYTLEYMYSSNSKHGNVDVYKYTEDKDEFGKTEYYVGITYFSDEIVELVFMDTELEFSEEAIKTFINYIL